MRILGSKPHDVVVRRGDTFRKHCTVRVKVTRAPINVTGFTFLGQIRSLAGAVLATITVTVTDAVAGEFDLIIPAATTAAIDTVANPIARYDVQWDNGTDVKTILKGAVYFETDVAL